MKRFAIRIVPVAIVVLFLSGCTRKPVTWKSDPAMQSVSNKYFNAKIIPQDSYNNLYWSGFNSFYLHITNNTDKNIELNWSKTLYMYREQTAGGFMIEGMLYKNRNDYWKVPDILFPGVVFSKLIFPSVLADGPTNGPKNGPMEPGANGIYLSVIVDGNEINEKLSVMLSNDYVKEPSPLSKTIDYLKK